MPVRPRCACSFRVARSGRRPFVTVSTTSVRPWFSSTSTGPSPWRSALVRASWTMRYRATSSEPGSSRGSPRRVSRVGRPAARTVSTSSSRLSRPGCSALVSACRRSSRRRRSAIADRLADAAGDDAVQAARDGRALLGDGPSHGLLFVLAAFVRFALEVGDVGAPGGGVPADQPRQEPADADADGGQPPVGRGAPTAFDAPGDDAGEQGEEREDGGFRAQPGPGPVAGDQDAGVVPGDVSLTGAEKERRAGEEEGVREGDPPGVPRGAGEGGVDGDPAEQDGPGPPAGFAARDAEGEEGGVTDNADQRDQQRLAPQGSADVVDTRNKDQER